MKLHLKPNDFKQLITLTSQNLGIREVYIEKDYWVCFILRNLSKSEYKNKIVFKGGTSLSKAHAIIHRFSEDVDLALVKDGLSGGQLKTLMKKVESAIAIAPLTAVEKNGITSKGSNYRKTVWDYTKVMDKSGFDQAIPEIILELNTFAKPNPYEEKTVQTYIAEFLKKQNETEIKEFGLQPFSVNVLDPKRTFIEKLFAIAKACFEDEHTLNAMKNKIRHIYDISMLYRNDHIRLFLESPQFKEIHDQVVSDDIETFGGASIDFKKAVIFKDPKRTLSELKSTYEGQFRGLVHQPESMPNIDEIESVLQKITSTKT